MPNFARPSADANNSGAYQNQVGGSSNLYQSIDEANPDDTDYIQSPMAPSTAVYVCNLSSVPDPGVDTDMILFARMRKDPAGAAEIDMTAELRQGYVNEGTQGTLICQLPIMNIDTTFTTYQHNLTTTEAATITDFANLFIRFTTNQP